MDACSYASATSGQIAVGRATINGNGGYIAGAFTNTGSSSIPVHIELGSVNSGCAVGTLLANSQVVQVSPGAFVEVFWGPRSVSSTWTGTAWRSNNPGYTDLGTACFMS